MKKWIFLLVAVCSTSLFAQREIENGSFENWKMVPWSGGSYEELGASGTPNLLKTLNDLIPISALQLPTQATAFKINDATAGAHAIKLVSAIFGNDESFLFVPGVVGTVSPDYIETFLDNGSITVSLPFVNKPTKLTGMYKYEPVNGDSAVIEVEIYSDDLTLATGYLREKYIRSEWTAFDINIDYEAIFLEEYPTEIRMLFISSAGYNFDDLMECKGQEGSALYLDDLKFEYGNIGLVEYIMPKVTVKTFPNPVAETAQFEFNEEVSGHLAFYDMQGRVITSVAVEGNNAKVNLSGLSHGNYIYRLIKGNEILCSGKIVKE